MFVVFPEKYIHHTKWLSGLIFENGNEIRNS
jgi:hypothetical protein